MLKLLLKNRLLSLMDRFAGQSKGKKAASAGVFAAEAILCILLLGCAAIGINALLGPMCLGFISGGTTWAIYGFLACFALLGSLFFTMFYAQGAIFEAKDNELLLSMPIPPSAILGSRIGSLYFLNLLFSLAAMGGAGYTAAVRGGSFTALTALFLLVCTLLLPLVSSTLSCLMGWAVSAITRHMRNKTLIQLILSLIGLGILYFGFDFIRDKLQAITADTGNFADAFRRVLYPLYAMGIAIDECSVVNLLIFAAFCIVPFGLVWLLLSKSFIRIVTARSCAKKQKYEATALKGSSVVWAMAKKDLTRFFGSPAYMLNTGAGLLYVLGMSIVALIQKGQTLNGLVEQISGGTEGAGAFIRAGVLALLAGFTVISSVSISVEAGNLWILKSMPVRAKDVMKGKFLSHILLAAPVSLVSSLLYMLALPSVTIPGAAVIFLLPLAAHIFCALSGLLINLFIGKTDYSSIAKAAKSSSSIIPMFVTAFFVALPFVLYILALKNLGLSFTGAFFAMTAFLVILDTGMYLFLGSTAVQKRWDKLGQQA